MTITDGARTQEDQAELFAIGRTKPGDKVTWTLNSRHIGGFAADVIPYPVDYEDLDRFHQLAGVIKAAASLEDVELEWGYDLWGKDYPHWQMPR